MIKVNSNVTTIELTGSEEKVQFAVPYPYYWILNTSGAEMYASISEGVTANTDGVVPVPIGGAACTMHGTTIDTVYVLGTGSCVVMGTYSAFCPFKTASGGGDGGGEATSYKILTGTVTPGSQDTQITFAEAFNTVPIVIGTMYNSTSNSNGRVETCHTTAISTTGCTFETRYIHESSSGTNIAGSTSGTLHWVAIGT